MKRLIFILLLAGCARQPNAVVDFCPPCLRDEVPMAKATHDGAKCICEKRSEFYGQ